MKRRDAIKTMAAMASAAVGVKPAGPKRRHRLYEGPNRWANVHETKPREYIVWTNGREWLSHMVKDDGSLMLVRKGTFTSKPIKIDLIEFNEVAAD